MSFDDDYGTDRPAAPRRFHQRIASLERSVVAIGLEVQRSIAEATEAWLRRDSHAARWIDGRTAGWSARALDAELASYELIATQQPMAVDLRRLVALVRLAEAVSRSGDLVAHIARSSCFDRNPHDFGAPLRALVIEMSTAAATELAAALDAYLGANGAASREVEASDRALDLLRVELFSALMRDGAAMPAAVDVALLGRYYERLGDQAVDIARRAEFVASGEFPSGPWPDHAPAPPN